MITSIHDLMTGDVDHITSSNCILARLWRLMLVELHVRPEQWEVLLADYIERAKDHLSAKEAHDLKGNVPKALVRDPLAFKSFCRGVSVLNFPNVQLRICTIKGTTEQWSVVNIPQTYTNDGGKYLKLLWQDVTAKWPEVTINWPEYMARYKQKVREDYNSDPSSIGSNLVRTLNDDKITWSVFYDGLMVHAFDSMVVQLVLERRSAPQPYIVQLRLVNQ